MDGQKPGGIITPGGQGNMPHDEAVTLRPAEPNIAPATPLPAPTAAPLPPAAPVSAEAPQAPPTTLPEPVTSFPESAPQPAQAEPASPATAEAAQLAAAVQQNQPAPQEPAAFGTYDDTPDDQEPVPSGVPTGLEPVPGEAEDPNMPEFSWSADEFVAHPKNTTWYAAFIGISAIIIVVAYLLTHRDIVTVVVLFIFACLFGYTASRGPRQMNYALTNTGVFVGNKFYPYKDFNAFAVVDEGKLSSIDFMPLKRFAPMLSVAYDPAHEDSLLEFLTQHLPFTQRRRSMIDGLMHRIHF